MGFAFAGGAALASQLYLGLTGFPGINPGPGEDAVAKPPGSPDASFCCNNIGNAVASTAELGKGFFDEGGTFGKWANILCPFCNATSGFHDFLTRDAMLGKSLMTNYPTMLPSFALTVTGAVDSVWLGGASYSLTVPLLTEIRLR